MIRDIVLPVVITVVVLATTAVSIAEERSPAQKLDSVVEAYLDRSLHLQPLRATQIGDHRFDDRLPDLLSDRARNEERALYTWCLNVLDNIDPKGLDDERRITWTILRSEAAGGLEGLQFPDHLLPVSDAFTSLPVCLPTLAAAGSIQPFDDVSDYEAFLSRMQAFSGWVDVAIANMRKGMAKGITVPQPLVERILPTLATQATVDEFESTFYEPIGRLPPSIPKVERHRLKAAYRKTIREDLQPAYGRLHRFMADEYLPACRASLGLAALPDGRAWYRHLVRYYTTTDLEPEEIFRTGLSEADRVLAEMEALVRDSEHGEKPSHFFSEMNHGRGHLISEQGELLSGYRSIGKRVQRQLSLLFSIAPRSALEIQAMDATRARALPVAHYQAGPADGSRPGVFFVNATRLPQGKSGMEALYLHEAVPGHHFQISLAREATGLPRYRRFLYQGAFIEGWALYAEGLGHDLGLYTDQFQEMGRQRMDLLRCARLVADVAIHHLGWNRQQVIEVLDRRALGFGRWEIDRYVSWPGQALTYKLGELRFRALRKRSEAALGDHFDVRAFHEQILSHGALPLDVLEEVVSSWLAIEMRKTATDGNL